MKFKTIRFKNFLSFGNAFTEMNLSDNHTYLITGENGAGKTTALEAFYFGMTGKPFRKIKKSELVNTINKKELLVEITFEHNGSEFLVKRGIKPDIFELYKDGKLVDTDSSRKDYQKTLELLIGVDSDTFANTIFISSKNYTPFLKLNASDRRNFIENVLNLKIFSEMLEELKVKRGIQKEKLTDIEYNKKSNLEKLYLAEESNRKYSENNDEKIKRLNEKNKEIEKYIEVLNRQLSDIEKKITDSDFDRKIEETEKKHEFFKNQYNVAMNKFNEEITEIDCQMNELRTNANIMFREYDSRNAEIKNESKLKYNKIKSEIEKLNEKNKELSEKIMFFENNKICPTCGQKIDSDLSHKNEITENIKNMDAQLLINQENIEQYNKDIKKLKTDCENALKETELAHKQRMELSDKEFEKLKIHKEDLQKRKNEYIEENSNSLLNLTKEINEINKQKNTLLFDKTNVEKDIHINKKLVENNLIEIKSLQNEKQNPLTDLEPFKQKDKEYDRQKDKEEYLYNDILDMINILSDKGIKSYIIKKYIPILNEYVNKYLEVFSAKYRIAFDENFDIEIFARGYEKLSYGSFSSGEEQRLDLSLLFAFYELGKMKKSINTNVIFLDEISDKSLDSDGIDGLMNIFNTLKRNGKTVYNISHRVEMQDRFDVTLKVNKKMFSKIERV